MCALTVHGGYAEYLVREADHFVPVPDGLDDGEVMALILNYVTAYQMIHRTARLRPGRARWYRGQRRRGHGACWSCCASSACRGWARGASATSS